VSYEREDQLRQRMRDADDQRHAAARELAETQADEHWQAGRAGLAMVVLHNHGWEPQDMIGFARRRGLSEDEARRVIADAPIDWR
jgi:hypothetical protein